MFKTITGKRVYNLTGSHIRMVNMDGRTVDIAVDGLAPAHRGGDWKKIVFEDDTFVDYHDESEGYDFYDVDFIDEFIPDSENRDWFAIVTVDYYIACRDMGLPTKRLFTVGEPIVDADGSIKGYKYLIKR